MTVEEKITMYETILQEYQSEYNACGNVLMLPSNFKYGLCVRILNYVREHHPDIVDDIYCCVSETYTYSGYTLHFPEFISHKPLDRRFYSMWWSFLDPGIQKRFEVLNTIITYLKTLQQ